ncbi:MlaE family ABC transporter permease [uncultured Mycobacterium sp.]|uniref:MlaE family ABC transporter permease n=1 Tax=uncultured Mycobacterium sp. TaxID=171292 RepID=UPI0035CC4058
MSTPSPLRPRLAKALHGFIEQWNRLGEQLAFYVTSLRLIGRAVVNYTEETLRNISQLALGAGALAVIGGATVVTAFVVSNGGILVGYVGHANLDRIGVFALAGVFTAYIVPRLIVPIIVDFGLAATVGAATTARLGAMRINDEIDALEVMGINAVCYLVSTRVLAGVIVAIPLACLSELATFMMARFVFSARFRLSTGGYDHYLRTFLNPTDTVYTVIQIAVTAGVLMLIHCYYGFTATGGPAGVGEATGRAVRASLIVSITVTFLMGLILYGRSGNFHLSA